MSEIKTIIKKKKLFDTEGQISVMPINNHVALKAVNWFQTSPKDKTSDSLRRAMAGHSVTDREGLERAYEAEHNVYARGDTLYVAGTQAGKLMSGSLPWNWGSGDFSKGMGDVWDDVTKIPFWGDIRESTRYQEAVKALKANPNIKRIVGHSLGGSVALQLQKDFPQLESRTFGAPVWDPTGFDEELREQFERLGKPEIIDPKTGMLWEPKEVERYRNYLDLISIFDRSANNSIKWNPVSSGSLTHAYDNIANDFQSGDDAHAVGWSNPDNTVSLFE